MDNRFHSLYELVQPFKILTVKVPINITLMLTDYGKTLYSKARFTIKTLESKYIAQVWFEQKPPYEVFELDQFVCKFESLNDLTKLTEILDNAQVLCNFCGADICCCKCAEYPGYFNVKCEDCQKYQPNNWECFIDRGLKGYYHPFCAYKVCVRKYEEEVKLQKTKEALGFPPKTKDTKWFLE